MGTVRRVGRTDGGGLAWCVGAYLEGRHSRGVPAAQFLVEGARPVEGALRRWRRRAIDTRGGLYVRMYVCERVRVYGVVTSGGRK